MLELKTNHHHDLASRGNKYETFCQNINNIYWQNLNNISKILLINKKKGDKNKQKFQVAGFISTYTKFILPIYKS